MSLLSTRFPIFQRGKFKFSRIGALRHLKQILKRLKKLTLA